MNKEQGREKKMSAMRFETVVALSSPLRMPSIKSRALIIFLAHCSVVNGLSTSSVSSSSHPTLSQNGNFQQPLNERSTITKLWADTADDRSIDDESGETRRSFFKTLTSLPVTIGCVATAGAGVLTATHTPTNLLPTSTTTPKLRTISDALALLEQRCDRKFLHSVVASDYRFLYRGMTPSWRAKRPTVVEGEASDLLLPETYGPEGLEFFRELDGAMEGRAVRPGGNGHLATTAVGDAAVWGPPASIWPLDGGWEGEYAHFAWYEDGGKFWPRPEGWAEGARSVDDGVLVDGINCGSLNLEDALRSKDGEVLFSTDSYLAIPAKWDRELREGLRNAFIL